MNRLSHIKYAKILIEQTVNMRKKEHYFWCSQTVKNYFGIRKVIYVITLKPMSFCLILSLYIDHDERSNNDSYPHQLKLSLVRFIQNPTHIQSVEFCFCRLERSGNGSNFSENIVFNFESQRSVVRTIGLSDGGGLLRSMVGIGPILTLVPRILAPRTLPRSPK